MIANDQGLYAGLVGGLVKVVREGDQVDVDPGVGVDLRTVADDGIGFAAVLSGGEDGHGMSISDTGFLAYELTFTDGSSGVSLLSITPVPDSATAGLAAAARLAALGC